MTVTHVIFPSSFPSMELLQAGNTAQCSGTSFPRCGRLVPWECSTNGCSVW